MSCTYLTVEEVRNYHIGCDSPSLACFEDAQIQDTIEYVTELVDMLTNDKWCSEEDTLLFDGTGTAHLFFSPLIPYQLNTLLEISISPTDCGCSTIQIPDVTNYSHWMKLGCTCRSSSSCSVWPRGCKNIHVRGMWGHAEVPPGIKRAAMLLVLDKLVPGIWSGGNSCGTIAGNVKQASWSDFQVTFDTSITGNVKSTGIIEVDRILQNYYNTAADLFLLPLDGLSPQAVNTCRNW